MAASVDLDALDSSSSAPPREQSLQQLFDAFRQNLQADIKEVISEFKADIKSLVSRTDHMDKKMPDFAKSHNALIDSHSTLEEEIAHLSTKVVDLEDRSRRNNIRICSISESITPEAVLPSCNQLDLMIDCIHRIPKPKNISPHFSRYVIARIHFFQTKDNLLRALQKNRRCQSAFNNYLSTLISRLQPCPAGRNSPPTPKF